MAETSRYGWDFDVQLKAKFQTPVNFKSFIEISKKTEIEIAYESENSLKFSEYSLRIPIKLGPFARIHIPPNYIYTIEPSSSQTEDEKEPVVYLVFKPKKVHACYPVFSLDEKFKMYPYELCVKARGKTADEVEPFAGSTWYYNDSGWWAQFGSGYVTHVIYNRKTGNNNNISQLALRAGAGVYRKGLQLETHYRARVMAIGSESISPNWLEFIGGYGLSLNKFYNDLIEPRVDLQLGMEYYKNTTARAGDVYIVSALSPLIGFRSRFIYVQRWEIGGDFRMSFFSQVQKYFIQGDLRYWFRPTFSLGAGYWVDIANLTSKGAKFREQTYALEAFARVLY